MRAWGEWCGMTRKEKRTADGGEGAVAYRSASRREERNEGDTGSRRRSGLHVRVTVTKAGIDMRRYNTY